MKICLISREYPTEEHTGGIGTYTEKTARALVHLGQTVCVITEAHDEASTRIEDGVLVVALPPSTGRPVYVSRARAVARAIWQLPWRPEIVQACEYNAEGFWYAFYRQPSATLVTHLATPSFLTQQTNETEDTNVNIRTLLRNRLLDRVERWQTSRSDAIVSETDALADIVSKRWYIPRGRIITLAQGVDFAERYAAEAVDLPTELRDKDYIIYFGRLEERKGLHILAQALPQVFATYPAIHVVFAGDDMPYMGSTMRAFVEQQNELHRGRLHFYPRLSHHELYPLLAHALAVVLPSLWENLANACLEALDMGKPVVATQGSGFSEVIEHGRSGILVPSGDVPALQQALVSLLRDRDRLRSMAGNAKERADLFSLDTKARQLLDLFKSLRNPHDKRVAITTKRSS